MAKKSFGETCEELSAQVASRTGSTTAFAVAVGVVVVWGLTGPLFNYSNTWQLVINTSTTIVTFLMVFLIQRSQNKDSLALRLKLNELVAAMKGASNRLIDVETLSERELAVIEQHYRELATLAKHDVNITESHSIDEARVRHSAKIGLRPRPSRVT